MRLSMVAGDTNTEERPQDYIVTLDGVKQTVCIIADEERGYIRRYKKTKFGDADERAYRDTDRRFVWRGSYHEEIVNLRIELDERDGFIYVREKVGKVWKQRFRSTSMPHVLKTLSIMFCWVDDAVDKEKYLERTNDKNDLGPTQ